MPDNNNRHYDLISLDEMEERELRRSLHMKSRESDAVAPAKLFDYTG
jgi:hypothetical protein